jgi:hypothetical protein
MELNKNEPLSQGTRFLMPEVSILKEKESKTKYKTGKQHQNETRTKHSRNTNETSCNIIVVNLQSHPRKNR